MSTLIESCPRTTPFSADQTAALIDQFTRDGYLLIRGLYSRDEVNVFRERIDRLFEDPKMIDLHHRYGDLVMARLFELDPMFLAMITREPIYSLMAAMLGPDRHIIAQSAIRNGPGQAIDAFHVDDSLWLPLPEEVPRHDPRMKFPNYVVGSHHALTDIDADEFGPLQVVPGSHYSGRNPNSTSNPTFEGRGPVSVHARAGDVYLQHPQVWHRGAPNTSSRTRCVFGVAWSKRFIAQRFYPFLNYRVPDHVLQGADERLLQALGKHPKGAFG